MRLINLKGVREFVLDLAKRQTAHLPECYQPTRVSQQFLDECEDALKTHITIELSNRKRGKTI